MFGIYFLNKTDDLQNWECCLNALITGELYILDAFLSHL